MYPAWTSKLIVAVLLFLLPGLKTHSQTAPNAYLITLTDKDNSPFSVDNPFAFLSQESIERRERQHIKITKTDLPVNPKYIDSIKKYVTKVWFKSRWFNTVTVQITDSANLFKVKQLPFVKKLQKAENHKLKTECIIESPVKKLDYGVSFHQIEMMHGNLLHLEGYKGACVPIAVLDAGFKDVNQIQAFSHLFTNNQLVLTHDFYKDSAVGFNEDSHGMRILSAMTGIIPGKLIGTAPEADYLLFRTEFGESEYIWEEDAWIAGIEKADSAGAWLVNSSLGYQDFDDSTTDHSYSDLDGKTTRISRAATMAARKGILVISSAGNEGRGPFYKISAPADADSILAVGAVDSTGAITDFSSIGPSFDGRIKPDIVAMGKLVYVASESDGETGFSSGTSASAPLVTGLAACLWQAFPDATNMEIRDAIIKSASQYTHPDTIKGYGIPDFYKAYLQLKGGQYLFQEKIMRIYPNPSHDKVTVIFYSKEKRNRNLILTDNTGRIIFDIPISSEAGILETVKFNIHYLTPGIYQLTISGDGSLIRGKIIKI